MSSSTQSFAQLFLDTGGGYSAASVRTAAVAATPVNGFQHLSFDLPGGEIRNFRFDPLMCAGTFAVRNVRVMYGDSVLLRIPPSDIVPFNQIAARVQQGGEVLFSTIPRADDPGVTFPIRQPLTRLLRRRRNRLMLVGALILVGAAILLIALYGPAQAFAARMAVPRRRAAFALARVAAWLSNPEFLPIDSAAVLFYLGCLALFFGGAAADLNGSSADIFPAIYHHGVETHFWLGNPRGSRADEWNVVTPDILNQAFRAHRFETVQSELGAHSVALIGNIPARHVSTLFRPQFWPFFALPVDYAFASYWQFKALLLLVGTFTWLLLITRSTFWSAAGSLWFFFSAAIQWNYSWPSALPEMIGLACLDIVFACYLTIGRRWVPLAIASLGTAICTINFTLCGYLPHMIPLCWVVFPFFAGWCIANWRQIVRPDASGRRILFGCLAIAIIAAAGFVIYRDLHQAILGIANTVYPGRRVIDGGRTPLYLLLSHFMQWTETEGHLPAALRNMCEGSGFLWLAPIALLCAWRLELSRLQKWALGSLGLSFCLLLAWLVVPIPAGVGAYLGLDRTGDARVFPALGLANVAIVALCGACLLERRGPSVWMRWAAPAAGLALFLFAFNYTNRKLDMFFKSGEVFLCALFASLLVFFFLERRKWAFAIALILPEVAIFGAVNPIERGLPMFTESHLRKFVRQNPAILNGKWLVFSDGITDSGFLAAAGCSVYTGLHYLPDVDHFPIFSANHLNLEILNRDGYLTAHLRQNAGNMRVELVNTGIVQWDVSPADPILKQIGIKYFAFDQPPGQDLLPFISPLSPEPIDGLWLYEMR